MRKLMPPTMPNLSIVKGLEREQSILADSYLVPYENEYFSGYRHENLPLLKSMRNRFKTYCVDRRKGLYINYGLRAGVTALKELVRRTDNLELKFVTINFSESYSQRVKASTSRSPMQKLSRDLKRNFFQECGVENYMMVIEESAENGTLHVHIVGAFERTKINDMKEALRTGLHKKKLALDKNEELSKRAIDIRDGYKRNMYKKYMSEAQRDMLELEIDQLDKENGDPLSIWMRDQNEDGTANYKRYVTRDYMQINAGLADYLSKYLHNSIFDKGEQYAFSRSLRERVAELLEQTIEKNKKS